MRKVYREAAFMLTIVLMICVFLAGMAITAGQMGAFYCCMVAGIVDGIAVWICDSEANKERKERKR